MINLTQVTQTDPEIMSGAPVFTGTRVTVRSLFDYLGAGDSIEEFLHQFPSVHRDQAVAVLDAAYESVASNAHIAG